MQWLIYYIIVFIILVFISILILEKYDDYLDDQDACVMGLISIFFPLSISIFILIVIYSFFWSLYKKYINVINKYLNVYISMKQEIIYLINKL